MRLYKLMNRQWAEKLVSDGSIRIGTLFDYGDTEKHGTAIGDDREGYRALYSRMDGLKSASNLTQFESQTIAFAPGTEMNMVNVVVQRDAPRSNLYLYSSMMVDSVDAQARINAENAAARRDLYDCCVEITNALRFMTILGGNMTTLRKAVFVARAQCTYADQKIDTNAPARHATLHPALVKRVDHAYQCEYRMLWRDSRNRNDIHPLNATIPDLRKYVRILR